MSLLDPPAKGDDKGAEIGYDSPRLIAGELRRAVGGKAREIRNDERL